MKLLRLRSSKPAKSQSLMELAIILPVLLILLSGVVEFGNLLNLYINLVDGAREGARAGSLADPFVRDTSTFAIDENFFVQIDELVEGKVDSGGNRLSKGAIDPVELNPATDDVVISFFSISGASVLRFPYAGGWSRWSHKTSAFSDSQVHDRLVSGAPDTGIVLVEVFYSYSQILKMPFFTTFVPDPIQVHTYAFMPLSAAEPTPTP
jgi:hypothetical protein